MPLKVGLNVFTASSQAGTDSGISGTLQAETVVKGKHGVRVQRNSDNNYWNETSGAYQAGATAEADELYFPGSVSDRNIHPAIRRLEMRFPQDLIDNATAAGLTILVYPEGEQATGAPTTASIVTDFLH